MSDQYALKSVSQDCFTVDSSISLRDAILSNYKQIYVNCRDGVLDLNSVFHYESGLKSVSYLTIKTKQFNSLFIKNGLVKLIKNGMQYLCIDAVHIDDLNSLIEYLYFYSSLKTIKILCKTYTPNVVLQEFNRLDEENSPNKKEFAEINSDIEKKCMEIEKLNQMVANFLANDLEAYRKGLAELKVLKDTSPTLLKEEQVKEAVAIGEQKNWYGKLREFHEGLSSDLAFTALIETSYSWNVEMVVSSGNVEKFKAMFPWFSSLDINARHKGIGDLFNRLIDIATRNNRVAMVNFLYEQGADIVQACDDDVMPQPPSSYFSAQRDLPNFPFILAMNGHNQELRSFFLSKEESLYDGLAWIIFANGLQDFKNIYESQDKILTIDFNKPIPKGQFAKFTLLQLIIHYHRTDFFLKICERTPSIILASLNTDLPQVNLAKYSGWSVLSVIIYKGMSQELEYLIKDADCATVIVESPNNHEAFQLLLEGAADVVEEKEYFSKKVNDFQRCFKILLTRIPFVLDVIMYDRKRKIKLLLLHFCIINQIFHIIEKFPKFYRSSMQKCVRLKNIQNSKGNCVKIEQEFNALQLAVWGIASNSENDTEMKARETLFEECRSHGLAESIREPLDIWGGLNVFQHSIVTDKYSVYQTLIKWRECPVNEPFPLTHTLFPGWLPIHVIILRMMENGMHSVGLDEILKREDLDITVPFSINGTPHYLAGYYPSSAIFFKGNPVKNSIIPTRIYSGCIKSFVPLFNRLSGRNKKLVLNQALLSAVMHHDIRQQYDHEKAIELLVEQGANPNTSINDQGDLIIDLARERGLLYLFPNHIDPRFNPASNQVLRLHENVRDSEFTGISSSLLHINEDYYSVISLVRNEKHHDSEHVFIVVEQIIRGRYVIHFIDFVKDLEYPGFGKVRHNKISGRISEKLLYNCKLPMMQIESLEDLRCQSWELPNEAATNFLDAVKEDEDKNKRDKAVRIQYALPGDRSMFAYSSSKKGHNCYTWARKKLLIIQSPQIEKVLKPTIDEWLITVPSLKDKRCNKSKCLVFTVLSGLSLAALCANQYYSNVTSFSSFKPEL